MNKGIDIEARYRNGDRISLKEFEALCRLAHAERTTTCFGETYRALYNSIEVVLLLAKQDPENENLLIVTNEQTIKQRLILSPKNPCSCSGSKTLVKIAPFQRHVVDIDFHQIHTPQDRFLWVQGPCLICTGQIVVGRDFGKKATGRNLLVAAKRKAEKMELCSSSDAQRLENFFAFYEKSVFWQQGDGLASAHLGIQNPMGTWF